MEDLLNIMNGYTIDDAKLKSITKEYFPMTEKHMIVVVLQHGSVGQNETRLYLDTEMHKDLVQTKPKLTGIERRFQEDMIDEMDSQY
jgi:hypothetical protein